METDTDSRAASRPSLPAWAWAALAGLLAVRLALLWLTPAELYPDEAQYWGWAQAPAWGYFSKPPLIAWLIAATTFLFGDAEWAARLSAPLCHTGAAAALALLGRDLYGRAAGLLAGAIWLSMMGVTLSSLVISTDAPLLLCWSVMLLALFRLVARPGWTWGIVFGAAIGLGFLAKYGIVYALVSLAVALAIDARVRAALLSRFGLVSLLAAGALLAPNLVWNAMNGMATIAHTADNADWSGSLLHPVEVIEFWIAQAGVFGLVLFPLLAVATVWALRGKGGADARLLAVFAATPLVAMSAQAFLAHAYANWAIAAYPAGAVLCAGFLLQLSLRFRRALIAVALGANVAMSAGLSALLVSPALADTLGLANAFKQVRGWDETTRLILDAADAGGFDTVVVDDRFVFHAVDYYGRDRPHDLAMWKRYDAPSGHAEMCCALPPGAAGPMLLVSRFEPYDAWFQADFREITPMGDIAVELGGGIERRLRLFGVYGFDPAEPRDGDTPPLPPVRAASVR